MAEDQASPVGSAKEERNMLRALPIAWLIAATAWADPPDRKTTEPDCPRLPVIKQAPDFDLIDAFENRVRLFDHRGKAVLVSFIFTTCNGTCPATTHRMAKLHEAVAKEGLSKQVQFLSMTLDPDRDRPETLRGYMRLYDIEGKTWQFLTGEPAAVKKAFAAWGMWAKNAPDGQLDHPSRIFLLDPQGRIREVYNLDFLRTPWVIEDLKCVLQPTK